MECEREWGRLFAECPISVPPIPTPIPMRKAVLFLALVAAGAQAQGRIYPEKKAFLVLGEALATGAGGPLGGTTLMQAMRVSAVTAIHGSHGIDVTATRLQTFLPPGGRAND